MIIRLLVDIFLIVPAIIYFKLRSSTSAYNFIVVALTLVATELIVVLRNTSSLYYKSTVECIEAVQPEKLINL